jgi:hypothetical protein
VKSQLIFSGETGLLVFFAKITVCENKNMPQKKIENGEFMFIKIKFEAKLSKKWHFKLLHFQRVN